MCVSPHVLEKSNSAQKQNKENFRDILNNCRDVCVFYVYLVQVTASDWDAGDNGRIQYSIPGTVGQMFHVDQQGVISIHAVVDREKYDSFRFPILAVDRSTAPNPPLTGSALVIINVEDVDDERPRFLQPHYVFGVYENEPEGKLMSFGQ
jgi:hypothetical protein